LGLGDLRVTLCCLRELGSYSGQQCPPFHYSAGNGIEQACCGSYRAACNFYCKPRGTKYIHPFPPTYNHPPTGCFHRWVEGVLFHTPTCTHTAIVYLLDTTHNGHVCVLVYTQAHRRTNTHLCVIILIHTSAAEGHVTCTRARAHTHTRPLCGRRGRERHQHARAHTHIHAELGSWRWSKA